MSKIDISKGYTLQAWHKDGVIYNYEHQEIGNVYENGSLAQTEGTYKHIAIVVSKKGDVAITSS